MQALAHETYHLPPFDQIDATSTSTVDATRCNPMLLCTSRPLSLYGQSCCACVPLVRCHHTTLPTCAPSCCRHGQSRSSLLSMRLDLLCLCALVCRRYTAKPAAPVCPSSAATIRHYRPVPLLAVTTASHARVCCRCNSTCCACVPSSAVAIRPNPLRLCAPHLMSLYDITDLWPSHFFRCCCGLLRPRLLSMRPNLLCPCGLISCPTCCARVALVCRPTRPDHLRPPSRPSFSVATPHDLLPIVCQA